MEWLASFFAVIAGLYSVNKLVLRWFKKRKILSSQEKEKQSEEKDIGIVAERLLLVFKSHGIEKTQIPKFLSDKFNLKLTDLKSNESILTSFEEPMLEDICGRFGISRQWLDGKDVPIYSDKYFDKNPNGYIDFLSDLKQQFDHIEGFAIKCKKDKLLKNNQRYDIALLFRTKITEERLYRETGIYRYFPLVDVYYWGYDRTRLQLKAFIFIAWQFGIKIFGCEQPEKIISQIIEGTIFPDPFIEKCHFVAWHPDEFIFTERESRAVNDSEEAILARKQMEHMKWMEKLILLTGPVKAPIERSISTFDS